MIKAGTRKFKCIKNEEIQMATIIKIITAVIITTIVVVLVYFP